MDGLAIGSTVLLADILRKKTPLRGDPKAAVRCEISFLLTLKHPASPKTLRD
jgi:hypothetical protein